MGDARESGGERFGSCGRVARAVSVACVCMGTGLISGCSGGGRSYINENDRLRSENLKLTRTVEKLEKKLEHRESHVHVLEQQLAGPVSVVGVGPADLPRVVEIKLGRLSGALDTDGNGVDDTVRLYVRLEDQRGRFLPAVGQGAVQVVAIQPGHEPMIVAQRSYTAHEWDRAYRSGLTGSHFTLEVGFENEPPRAVDRVTVSVVFTDAATGVHHSVERAMKVRLAGSVDEL